MTVTADSIVFVRRIHLFFCGERKISTSPIHYCYLFFCEERKTSTLAFFCSSFLLVIPSMTLKIYHILANCVAFHSVQLKFEEEIRLCQLWVSGYYALS